MNYDMTKAYEAAKNYVALVDRIKESGRPPHTDFWSQSLFDREKAVVQAFCELNEADGWIKEMRQVSAAKPQ